MKKRFVTILGCVVLTVALFCGCGVAPDSGKGEAVPDGSSDLTWNTDGENYEYDSIAEQGFCDVRETPSSYFSLDRNTAGYSFVRAQIRCGWKSWSTILIMITLFPNRAKG